MPTKRYINLGKNGQGEVEYLDTKDQKIVVNRGGNVVVLSNSQPYKIEYIGNSRKKFIRGNQGNLVDIESGEIYQGMPDGRTPKFIGQVQSTDNLTPDGINLPSVSGNRNTTTTPITSPNQTIAERRTGRNSSLGVGITSKEGSASASPTGSVKAVQEYLNSFFYEMSLKQKGYTRGTDGKVYDDTGKQVPLDKINTTAKNERIAEDGKFGPETESALTIYNLANPKSQIKFDKLPSGAGVLSDKSSVEQIQQFYKDRTIPRYGVQKVNPIITKMKGTDIPKKLNVPVGNVVSPIKQPEIIDNGPSPYANLFNRQNLERIGGNLADTLSIANLLRESSQPLPSYQQTPDWVNYTNQVANNANRGLSSAVQAEFNRGLNTNRMSGYGQVVSAAGGGGTQGAVLGALGQVNDASANAIGKFAVADQAQRDQNLQNFGRVAQANEATNMNMFGIEYQNAAGRQQQAASMIPGVMAQIGQRNQTYSSYGPGSVYEQYVQSQIQRSQQEADLAKGINSNYGALFGTSITPTAKVSERDKALLGRTANLFGI